MARSPLYDIYDPTGILRQQAEMGLLPSDEMEIEGVFPLNRKATLEDLMPEQEKTGMLRRLAGMGSSGLSALGWLLDTPGAFVRGTISGLAKGDPLKGARDIFASSDDRTTGRELLRQFGMAGKDDTWNNFFAGTAAEVLTDPLTLLNPAAILGRGAYGTAGRALKNAGLLDDAALMAKTQGKGIRKFLRDSTAEDIINQVGGDAAQRFETAAKGLKRDPASLLQDRVAGLMEARIPGTEYGTTLSFGKAGDWLAEALDTFGEGFKQAPIIGPVVNRARAAFDPSVMGEIDPERQWTMRTAWSKGRAAERAELGRLGELQWEALQADTSHLPDGLNKFSDARIQNAIRDLVEAGGDVTNIVDAPAASAVLNTPQWAKVYKEFADRGPEYFKRAKDKGLMLGDWTGKSGDMFFPSQSVWFNNEILPDLPDRLRRQENPFSRGNRVLGLDENFSRPRDPAYDLQNRSQTFRRLMSGQFGRDLQDQLINANDADIPAIMDKAFAELQKTTPGWKLPYTEGMQEIQDLLADPTLISADRTKYTKELAKLVEEANRKKTKLGDLLRRADRQFADQNVGLFDESAFDAMSRYAGSRARVEANADVVTAELIQGAVENQANKFAGGGWLPLNEAAKQLGFDPKTFGKVVQAQTGKDITNFAINEKLIASLKKLAPMADPTDDGIAGKAWNTFTNAFKIGALANPAYHVRNLYSGNIATLTGGASDPISLIRNAYAGYKAGKGDYRAMVNRLRNAPGFENLTDSQIEQKVLAGMARNRLGGGEITDLNGAIEQATTGLFPGADAGGSVPWIGKDGLLWDSDRKWRDWATVRGVDWMGITSDRAAPKRTTNPFLQLHERVGKGVEDANRLGAYISMLQRGASPDAAADLVFKTQVDYSPRAFTEFERGLKKLVPFYSYQRGIAPLVAENILYRPGGLQGQAIRFVNRASEPSEERFLPEHLRQTTAIPLTEALGGKPAPNLQRVVTNIDAPYEGLINMFSPGVGNTLTEQATDSLQKTGMNLLGQLNPLIKAPLEMILNRQLYTGRELSDLYSVLERDLGSVGRPLEQIGQNFVPGGTKLLGIYRTATDDRLSLADKALKLLVNNLAGVKLTDVDQERTRRLAARQMLNSLLSTVPGVRTYENITVPPEKLAAMPEQQKRMYLLYKIIQSQAAKRKRQQEKAQQLAVDPLQLLGVIS